MTVNCPVRTFRAKADGTSMTARREMYNASAGLRQRLHDRCSCFNVIDFSDRTGIEEITRQSETLLTLGGEFGRH